MDPYQAGEIDAALREAMMAWISGIFGDLTRGSPPISATYVRNEDFHHVSYILVADTR